MNRLKPFRHAKAAVLWCAGALFASSAISATNPLPWVGTWSVSPQITQGPIDFRGKTVRQIMHTSVAGTAARIHLSNLFGDVPLKISDVHIALRDNGSAIRPETDKPITFSGARSVTVPPGGSLASDAVSFNVPALSDVVVSFYVPAQTRTITGHSFSNQNKYVATGDVSGQAFIQGEENGDYVFLTNLDVQGTGLNGAIVAIGASITDGYLSSDGQNKRWTNDLAARIVAAKLGFGILNQGITGNGFVLEQGSGPSTVNRFDRDVLSQAGVRYVIVSDSAWNDLETNDPVETAADLIPAMKGLIDKAHAQGVRFICGTLTPGKDGEGWTTQREAEREKINTFIRTAGSGCDAVYDQDTPLRDPADPLKYLPAYDAGDHIHPNDAGYQVLANAFNLAILKSTALDAISSPQGCGTIGIGEGLKPGQSIVSCDSRFRLTLQTDGNLVLNFGASVLWASNTANRNVAQLELAKDGNFFIVDKVGNQVWASNSGGQKDARVFLQNDGNLVEYNQVDAAVWYTATYGH